jgi:hypothetical protein
MSTWPRYPTIYEINTWVWLAELSAKARRSVDLGSVPFCRMGCHRRLWLRCRVADGSVGTQFRGHFDRQSKPEPALRFPESAGRVSFRR